MILVLLGHIGLDPHFNDTYLHKWIYGFHMPLFFWIAGYLFKLPLDGIYFMVKKIKRLMVPYFILTTIVFFPKVLLSGLAMRPQEGGLINYFIALIYPVDNPVLPLWFLIVLFEIYGIGFISIKIIKDKPLYWLITGLIFGLLGYIFKDIQLLGISSSLKYFPYFCLGLICKKLGIISRFVKISNTGLLICCLIIYSICIFYPINSYILAVLGLFASIQLMTWFEKNKIPFFPDLRKYTFCIYLLQWFPMVFVRIVFYKILGWNEYICYILMFSLGLLVPIIIAKIIEQFKMRGNIRELVFLSIGLRIAPPK